MSQDIQKFIEVLREFRKERNWERYHTPKNLAISIGIETAELQEYVQWADGEELQAHLEKYKEDVADEVADIFTYLVGFCDVMDIDILEASYNKLEKIRKKYPADMVNVETLDTYHSLKKQNRDVS